MNESEIPKRQFPTADDVLRLGQIVQTKATGANVHKLMTHLAIMMSEIEKARMFGWDETKLKVFNEEKDKLNKSLFGLK